MKLSTTDLNVPDPTEIILQAEASPKTFLLSSTNPQIRPIPAPGIGYDENTDDVDVSPGEKAI